jgi:large conductance mechanosensitive channel
LILSKNPWLGRRDIAAPLKQARENPLSWPSMQGIKSPHLGHCTLSVCSPQPTHNTMLKEFKEFAFKGNLVDMAVGFILGGAFATVVKTLVAKVIMPPLGLLLGDVDFNKLKYVLKPGVAEVKDVDGNVTTAAVEEVAIGYGEFLSDFIAFVMLAFVVFIVVKKFIAAFEKKEAEAPAAPPKQEVLLEEIRDALKK